MNISENYSLKNFNTFHVDVSAKYFFEFSNLEDLKSILFNSDYSDISRLVLGSGSNVLFTKDFNGIVLKNNLKGISVSEEGDFYYLKSASGEIWSDFVKYSVDNNLSGLENLSLIPGTVGAAVVGNIGAYGLEICNILDSAEIFNIENGEVIYISNFECKFGYRNSIFKNEFKDKFIVISATFKLPKIPKFNIEYADVKKELESFDLENLNSKVISETISAIRTRKLPDVNVLGNAGSFFKNPEISIAKFNELKNKFPEIVSYDLPSGDKKLAAAWLIDQCGFKGKVFGNVGAYEKQALVIVNYGGATGREIYDFSQNIVNEVNNKFGVVLEREVNVV